MNSGFTLGEWQEMRSKRLSYQQEAVTSLAPFGGLSSNSLAHLRDEWITWLDERVEIRIPSESRCNSFKSLGGEVGGVPPLERREQVCNYCRAAGETDRFERLKQDFNEGTTTDGYRAILHREIAEPAVEFLKKVFKTYDRPEIGAAPDGILDATQRVTEDLDTSGEYPYRKLVRTGPVIYHHYGLKVSDIVQLTPFSRASVMRCLRETPGVSNGGNDAIELLKIVHESESVQTTSIAEKMDVSYATVHERMKRLKQEGKVSESNAGYGKPAATWNTNPGWDSPFRCENCGYETQSLQGIRTHRTKSH